MSGIELSHTAEPQRHRRTASRWSARVPSLLILAGCAGVLCFAAWLEPSSAGLGTHTQLGMPQCGFYATTGLPCATCGMTTAFSHAVRGQLLAALITQPAGAVLAVLVAAAAILSAYAAITGVSLLPITRWIWRPRIILGLGAFVFLAWIYKAITAGPWAT